MIILMVLVVVAAAVGFVGWLRWSLLAVTVSGTSMLPALAAGDRVLVRRGRVGELRPGQIVVALPGLAELPVTRQHPLLMIKRVHAVAGDPVPRAAAPALPEAAEAAVPAGRLVLLGDNPAGTDSRQLGYFHTDRLLGVVIRRLPGRRG